MINCQTLSGSYSINSQNDNTMNERAFAIKKIKLDQVKNYKLLNSNISHVSKINNISGFRKCEADKSAVNVFSNNDKQIGDDTFLKSSECSAHIKHNDSCNMACECGEIQPVTCEVKSNSGINSVDLFTFPNPTLNQVIAFVRKYRVTNTKIALSNRDIALKIRLLRGECLDGNVIKDGVPLTRHPWWQELRALRRKVSYSIACEIRKNKEIENKCAEHLAKNKTDNSPAKTALVDLASVSTSETTRTQIISNVNNDITNLRKRHRLPSEEKERAVLPGSYFSYSDESNNEDISIDGAHTVSNDSLHSKQKISDLSELTYQKEKEYSTAEFIFHVSRVFSSNVRKDNAIKKLEQIVGYPAAKRIELSVYGDTFSSMEELEEKIGEFRSKDNKKVISDKMMAKRMMHLGRNNSEYQPIEIEGKVLTVEQWKEALTVCSRFCFYFFYHKYASFIEQYSLGLKNVAENNPDHSYAKTVSVDSVLDYTSEATPFLKSIDHANNDTVNSLLSHENRQRRSQSSFDSDDDSMTTNNADDEVFVIYENENDDITNTSKIDGLLSEKMINGNIPDFVNEESEVLPRSYFGSIGKDISIDQENVSTHSICAMRPSKTSSMDFSNPSSLDYHGIDNASLHKERKRNQLGELRNINQNKARDNEDKEIEMLEEIVGYEKARLIRSSIPEYTFPSIERILEMVRRYRHRSDKTVISDEVIAELIKCLKNQRIDKYQCQRVTIEGITLTPEQWKEMFEVRSKIINNIGSKRRRFFRGQYCLALKKNMM